MYTISKFNRQPSLQSGLSLVELLISLFLSSLMIVALFAFFANIKANASAQDIVLETQHSVRMATDLIRSEVQKAGFKNDMSLDATDPFDNTVGGFDEKRYVRSEVTAEGEQVLHIRYQSDGLMRDCVGNQAEEDEVVQVSLFLRAGQLMCQSTIDGGALNEFTMLDGIATLSFSYLDQTTGLYESSAQANGVRSVKFEMTFSETVVSGSGVPETIRRGYTQVAALRNL